MSWKVVMKNQYSDEACVLVPSDEILGFYEVRKEDRDKICTLLMEGDVLTVEKVWSEE